jgi:iron complex transport system permease protein
VNRWSLSNLIVVLLASLTAWAVVAALCLCVGSTGTHWPQGMEVIFRRESVVLASLVGAALACAGVAYQSILRNPLADPYLLGASSGATLAGYLWQFPAATPLLAAMSRAGMAAGQQSFAFIGAIASVAIVLALAGRRGRIEPITLLLVGVIVNAVNGSLFLLVNAIHRDLPASGGAVSFLVGGLGTVTAQQRNLAVALITAGWIVLLYVSGQLNVATLEEAEAQSLGVRIHQLRWIALLAASLVTAAAVAVSGPIGFVGLVCPHLARLIVGPDPRKLLPLATATGAMLLAGADALSRHLASQDFLGTQLPVGVLTGLLGGPFFLALLWKSQKQVR